jgi:hypothetical protein
MPPPHFQTFRDIALFSRIGFSVLFGLTSCLLAYLAFVVIKQTVPSAGPVGYILLGLALFILVILPMYGALFGLCMAGYFHRQAKRFNLPSWEEYPKADQVPQ